MRVDITNNVNLNSTVSIGFVFNNILWTVATVSIGSFLIISCKIHGLVLIISRNTIGVIGFVLPIMLT